MQETQFHGIIDLKLISFVFAQHQLQQLEHAMTGAVTANLVL